MGSTINNALYQSAQTDGLLGAVNLITTVVPNYAQGDGYAGGIAYPGVAANVDHYHPARVFLSTYNSNVTLSADDAVVLCNDSVGFTVTLGPAANRSQRIYYITNIGTGPIVVAADGIETINGIPTYSLPTQYSKVTIVSDGVAWYVIG